ncbi:Neutral protease 2 [Mycena indigotica]|uniref:Neutral protease 2 n=1 Tax=Mycena indigotica TaxID=2126181 RepID=A0A8H6SQV2_9AGAR|nr:Neutral protease 2 [Mycena indigotica]KAF7304153.1 Neutral protease 2 [Mycena indigotica]
MLFSVVTSLLPALALAMIPPTQRAAGGLSVKVSVPKSDLASTESFVLTAAVTNNGAESLKVLKYGTILDGKLPTRSFTVTRGDVVVPFKGVKLSVSLADADESAFVTIPAGETVTVTHDVSALYDFASLGAGAFTFAPISSFQIAQARKAITRRSELQLVEFEAEPVTITVSGAISNRALPQRRAVNICKTSSRKSFINASLTEAKELAATAASYISSQSSSRRSNSSDSLYTSYFGKNPSSRVISIFNAVKNEKSTTRKLSCVDTHDACDGNVIAYTLIATTDIYFCDIFFKEVAHSNLCKGTTVASRSVRGGTTLHEFTHALSKTVDVSYGCENDQALSDAQKIRNADNFNCFATQVYADTACSAGGPQDPEDPEDLADPEFGEDV